MTSQGICRHVTNRKGTYRISYFWCIFLLRSRVCEANPDQTSFPRATSAALVTLQQATQHSMDDSRHAANASEACSARGRLAAACGSMGIPNLHTILCWEGNDLQACTWLVMVKSRVVVTKRLTRRFCGCTRLGPRPPI